MDRAEKLKQQLSKSQLPSSTEPELADDLSKFSFSAVRLLAALFHFLAFLVSFFPCLHICDQDSVDCSERQPS